MELYHDSWGERRVAFIDCEVELRRTNSVVVIATMLLFECPRIGEIIEVPVGSYLVKAKVTQIPPDDLRVRLCRIVATEIPQSLD